MQLLWLDQVALENRLEAGGKAAVLGTLLQAGLPVPQGFCIPAGFLEQLTANVPGQAEEFWSLINQAYQKLAPDCSPVAVRSSAGGEDSTGASFAGQYETILDVRGEAALADAVRRCLESARGHRAQVYQTRRGVSGGRMAVLVQAMAPARVSGVLFTQDPVSGDRSQMLVEAAPGLGDQLVAGHAAPARVWMDRTGQPAGGLQDLLSDQDCHTLAALGNRIEELLGPGQDIEWAIGPEGASILQARPVTYRRPTVRLSEVWTRANVGEVLPNVVTPLTWSVFRATLQGRPTGLDRDAGLWEDDQGGDAEAVRCVRGRVFIRQDALLDAFCYLPAVTPAVVGHVLGAVLPGDPEAYIRPGSLAVRLAQAVFGLDTLGLLPRLAWIAGRIPAPPPAGRQNLNPLLNWIRDCFRVHLKATAYAIGAYGLLSRLRSERPSGRDELLLPLILVGHADLQTAAQGRALQQLAGDARSNPALSHLLESGQDWDVFVESAAGVPGGAEFVQAMRAFLNANGARAAEEFELSVPRWREDPSFILAVLRKHLAAGEHDPLVAERFLSQRRQTAIDSIRLDLTPLESRFFDRLIASYRRYATLRENVKYRLMEGFARLRESFLETGSFLAEAGLLVEPGDIFFLTLSEIGSLGDSRDRAVALQMRVRERKDLAARWSSLRVPGLLFQDGGLPEESLAQARGALEPLAGIGSSPGVVDGLARVLMDPSQANSLLPGEILVAPHTDPGWTPLFLTCKAVVTELGGFLSHGATVAREYGIPCVVNVPGATRLIHTGDFIRVDGTNGQVILCASESELPVHPEHL